MSDSKVATPEREAHPRSDRGSVDDPDHGDGEGPEDEEALVEVDHDLLVVLGRVSMAVKQPVEVATGGEGATFAPEDGDPQIGRL